METLLKKLKGANKHRTAKEAAILEQVIAKNKCIKEKLTARTAALKEANEKMKIVKKDLSDKKKQLKIAAATAKTHVTKNCKLQVKLAKVRSAFDTQSRIFRSSKYIQNKAQMKLRAALK